MNKFIGLTAAIAMVVSCTNGNSDNRKMEKKTDGLKRPNILLVISDDQSYPHASAYGWDAVHTPAFDRIAEEGILFTNTFAQSPSCSPSRASILTGRYPWQIEEAGSHNSLFPARYAVYPDLLEQAGYLVGYDRKGWRPGDWEASGRTRNPAGDFYLAEGIYDSGYEANFAWFLEHREDGQPFAFWYGANEPHRSYEKGSGLRHGKRLEDVDVPPFLPDTEVIRSDLLDYALQIEGFDRRLGSLLAILEETGELDNTIIVVVSDQGMPFPRAKATLYEFGLHVPMAIRWGDKVKGNRIVDDLVGLIDLMPTFLEAANVAHPDETDGKYPMSGRSLMKILVSNESGIVDPSRNAVFAGSERHGSARWNNLGYPSRSVRTHDYHYIRNFKPERWPAGAPQRINEDGSLGPMHGVERAESGELQLVRNFAYTDIGDSPSKLFLIENREHPEYGKYFDWAVGLRPAEELYDIKNDPGCINNLAGEPAYHELLMEHRALLGAKLMTTNDPRVTGMGDIFESYPRMAWIGKYPIPEWAIEKYVWTSGYPIPKWAREQL